MRFNEFAGTHSLNPISEAVLLEIDFNSKSVQQQSLSAPIMCGFEAETIWPSLGSGMSEDDVYDEVNDLSWDEFRSSEYSSEMTSREERAIEQAYRDWAIEEKFPDIESEMIEEWVDDNIDDYTEEYFDDEHTDSDLDDWLEENDSSIDDYGVEDSSDSKKRLLAIEDFVISEHGSEYREWLDEYARQNDEVTDAAMDRAFEIHTLDDWIASEYGSMMEMLNNHDVFIDVDSDGNLQEVADIIETELDVSAVVGSYHSGTTDESTDDWRVEEDSSLSGPGVGAEIISPVYDSPQKMLSVMRDLFDVLQDNSVETQSAYDTGLHITMSWAGETSPTNRLKMALLLGDEHVLETFGRLDNSYARSMMTSLRQAAADKNTELVNTTVENIEGELSKNIRLQKYSAINFKGSKNSQGNEIIEFRAAGGDDYHLNMKRIQDTVVRYAAIMRAGHDAAAYRKDYVSSIFRLLKNAAQPGTNIAGTEFVPAPKDHTVEYQKKTYISNGDGTWDHDGEMVVSKRLNRILNDIGGKNVASKGSADIKTHNSIKPAADLLYNFANQNNLRVKNDLAVFAKTYSEFMSRYGDNEQIIKQLGLVTEDTHNETLQTAKGDLHKLKNSFAGILINLALALGKNSKTPLKIIAAIRKIGKSIGFDYQTDIMSPDVVEWRQKPPHLRAQTVAAINSVLKLTTPLKFTYLEMNRRVMHNIAMMYLRATNAQRNWNVQDAVKKLSQVLLSDPEAVEQASRFDAREDYPSMETVIYEYSHLFAEHSSDDRFQQAVQYVNTLPELDRSDLASTSAADGINQIRRLFTQALNMLREEYNDLPQTQQAQFVQTLHRLVDSIAVYLDNPTITRYHYLPPPRSFEEIQDVVSLLHRLYHALPTDITHLADAVKNSDDPEETKQKVIAMLNQILSELAKTSQQLGVKMPGAIDLNMVLGQSMTYDNFVTLPLQEQMATVDKLDTVKLNEAWSKKYKRSIDCDNPKGFSQRAHCAGKRKRRKSESVSEGVPNLDPERAVKKLLSDHFPVGDVGKQMQAYAAVPVPEMLSDFRHLHAEQGADACARGILRNYAEWYFSNRSGDQMGQIMEAALSVSELKKHAGEYLDNLLTAIRNGDPIKIEDTGRNHENYGKEVIIKKDQADTLARLYYKDGDPQNIEITQGDLIVPVQELPKGKGLLLTTEDDQKIPLGVIDKSIVKGRKRKQYNKGDIAEAFLGVAITSFFQNNGTVTEQSLYDIVDDMDIEESGRNWSGKYTGKIKHNSGKQDLLEFNVNLRAASLKAVKDFVNGDLKDSGILGIVRSAVSYAESVDKNALQEALEMIRDDANQNSVIVTSDGVSDQTGTKADLVLSIDDTSYNLISLKVGDIKQFGQVSGYTFDVIYKFMQDTFNLEIPQDYASLGWDTPAESIASYKKIVADFIAPELSRMFSGGPGSDAAYVENIFRGIRYHAVSDDDGVQMVILKQTPNAPGFSLLRFDDRIKEQLYKLNLGVHIKDDADRSITIKIYVDEWLDPELEEQYNTKYGRSEPILIQLRSGVIFEAKDYMRNRVEMGPVLKLIAGV